MPEQPALRRPLQTQARRVARAVRARQAVADQEFDRFLPPALHAVSPVYWTPLTVVRHVATWVNDIGVRTVVDVGSGAGKFCVALALMTRCQIGGVERRAALVPRARALASLFRVDDRVTFLEGDVPDAAALAADLYYFFNPFGDYVFHDLEFDEPAAESGSADVSRSLGATLALLSDADAGTFVVTFNGVGSSFPDAYEQLAMISRLPGTLRLWKKKIAAHDAPADLRRPRFRTRLAGT